MVQTSNIFETMPQRVPSGGLSPPSGGGGADYSAVFAAESFDLSLLPPSPSILGGIYDPIKEEPSPVSLFSWESAYSPADPYSPREIKQETTIDLDEPTLIVDDRKDGIIRSLLESNYNNNTSEKLQQQQDHKLLREVLKDTSFQKKYNLIPVSVGELGTGFRTEMEEVSMDLAQEEIEPMLSLAMEQLKTEVYSTCSVLGISRDPSKWTIEEVETWISWNLAQYNLPPTIVQYFKMPGPSLVTLTEQDFQQRAPEGGALLHAQLELWKAASMDETTVDVSGLLHETTTTRSASSSGEPSDDEEDDEMGSTSQSSPKCSTSRASGGGGSNSGGGGSGGGSGSGGGGSHIHLWQFLKELLNSPATYGTCIRWVDRQSGVFKIEDSVKVARLWGQRKNRPAMNYDKLSRSIRQYYKKGIMKKTERSQRLVYQFCHPYSL